MAHYSMISRKSAKLIADTYMTHFKTGSLITYKAPDRTYYTVKNDEVNTFFYEREYETWFLQIMRRNVSDVNQFHNALTRIHTGETLIAATKDWELDRRLELGQRILKSLAEDIIKLYENVPEKEIDYSQAGSPEMQRILKAALKINRSAADSIVKLKAQLEIDGYIYRDGVLYPAESSIINEEEEQNLLEMLVKKLTLANRDIILNHLKLSEEHYLNGKWGDSISNSRNFLEAILENVAHALHAKKRLTTNPPNRPVLVREFLERQGFVDIVEKESISKVYGLISNTGSHPNIAEKDQARLMRHLALTFSQFVLLRYEGYLQNNP